MATVPTRKGEMAPDPPLGQKQLNATRRPRTWGASWRWLVEPRAGPIERKRRRARVLAWLLLTLILMIGVALLLVFMFQSAADGRRGLYVILIAGLLVLLLLAFGLNHAGHFSASAGLTIVCAVLGPWGSILLDRAVILRGDFVPLIYIVLSVLLASILLSARVTVILAAVQFTVLLLLPLFSPATASINWPSLLGFIFFTSILSVVSNFVTRKDLEQIDWQTGQLVESETRLRELSVRDPLTGLFNRRYLEETLERELRRIARLQRPLGIIMLDIDHFKRFNDTYGHAAGDAVLRQLGDILCEHVRGADVACRYGGEEFTLILPEASREVTRERAERLRTDAKRIHVQHEGQTLKALTLSLGVAVFPDQGTTGTALLGAADAALYRAKGEGRDRVVVAE